MEVTTSKAQHSLLTRLLLQYKNTSTADNYDLIHDAIFKYAYNFPELLSPKNKEHRGDFALYIVEKIPRLIDRFEYYGNPFDGYLYRTFKAQFYTYIKNYNQSEKNSNIISLHNNYKIFEMPTHIYEPRFTYEDSVDYYSEKRLHIIEEIIELFKQSRYYQTFCKRIWIYLLKHSTFLQDERIIELVSKIGIPRSECISKLNKLSTSRKKQRNIKLQYEAKCIRAYAKCISREQNLYEDYDFLSRQERKQYLYLINQAKYTYEKSVKILKNKNFSITNTILSDTLNIPKPAIDSAVYHLKMLCKKHSEKIENNHSM